jgi:hypothetical protein
VDENLLILPRALRGREPLGVATHKRDGSVVVAHLTVGLDKQRHLGFASRVVCELLDNALIVALHGALAGEL